MSGVFGGGPICVERSIDVGTVFTPVSFGVLESSLEVR